MGRSCRPIRSTAPARAARRQPRSAPSARWIAITTRGADRDARDAERAAVTMASSIRSSRRSPARIRHREISWRSSTLSRSRRSRRRARNRTAEPQGSPHPRAAAALDRLLSRRDDRRGFGRRQQHLFRDRSDRRRMSIRAWLWLGSETSARATSASGRRRRGLQPAAQPARPHRLRGGFPGGVGGGSGASERTGARPSYALPGGALLGNYAASQTLDYLGTARLRLGYVLRPSTAGLSGRAASPMAGRTLPPTRKC